MTIKVDLCDKCNSRAEAHAKLISLTISGPVNRYYYICEPCAVALDTELTGNKEEAERLLDKFIAERNPKSKKTVRKEEDINDRKLGL